MLGRWRIVHWEYQHVFHDPYEKTSDHMGDWKPQDFHQTEEIPSNLLIMGIKRENLANAHFTDVEIEFTDKPMNASNPYYHDVMIYLKENLLQKTHWEIEKKPEIFEFKICLGEVYHDAMFTVEKLNDNELILIENMFASESEADFQRISLKKVQTQSQSNELKVQTQSEASEIRVPRKRFRDIFKFF